MKKIKLMIYTTALLLFSCSVDDTFLDSGNPGSFSTTNIDLSPTSVSYFDQDAATYDLFVYLGIVDQVEAIYNDSSEDVSITDKAGSFSASFEDYGLSEIGDEVAIDLVPIAGTQVLDTVSTSVSVFNPISISAPELILATREADTLFSYEVTTTKTLSDVLVESKIFYDGTYEEVVSGTTDLTGSVDFNASSFTKLDTVYYRVTATTEDGLVASEEAQVFIDTEYFENSSEASLLSTNEYYTFPDLASVDDVESALIEFVSNSEINSLDETLTFVEYTGADGDTFEFADMLEAIEVYESGTAISSISPIGPGMIYVYQLDDVYGLLSIDSVDSTTTEDGTMYTVNVSIKN